jgi:hypothetical protein
MIYHKDYIWREGIPYPTGQGSNQLDPTLTLYKIAHDSYHKRISIEEYIGGKFSRILYDSALLEFRNLKPQFQIGWEKIPFESNRNLIRDEADRVVWIEEYEFKEDRCIECRIRYPDGPLLAQQKICYTALGDSFNGVILNDSIGKVVMKKSYSLTPEGEFDEVLQESWTSP